MKLRQAKTEDILGVSRVESLSFPEGEASSETALKNGFKIYPSHYYVMVEENKVIGQINGLVSNHKVIDDEMFYNARLHNEEGDWQMILGLAVHPDYRMRGIARALLEQFIEKSREENRKGLVLTCKKSLIAYYNRFGFVDEGISDSQLGGSQWYDMRLVLDD